MKGYLFCLCFSLSISFMVGYYVNNFSYTSSMWDESTSLNIVHLNRCGSILVICTKILNAQNYRSYKIWIVEVKHLCKGVVHDFDTASLIIFMCKVIVLFFFEFLPLFISVFFILLNAILKFYEVQRTMINKSHII